MKIKFTFLICFLYAFIGVSFAQEIRQKYIGFETGMTLIGNEITKMDNIRGDVSGYSGGYSSNNLTSLSYRSFIGVKPEIFSFHLCGSVAHHKRKRNKPTILRFGAPAEGPAHYRRYEFPYRKGS